MLFLPILCFAILTALTAAGSANLLVISFVQAGGIHRWLAFDDPFNLFACVLAILATQGLARPQLRQIPPGGLNGQPFPVADQTLLFVLSAAITTLWLGACYDPFGIVRSLETRWQPAAFALGIIMFLTKTLLLTWFQNHVHANLPRYRLDELLDLGFKTLVPAAAFNLLAAAAYLWLVEPLPEFQSLMHLFLLTIGSLSLLSILAFFLHAPRTRSREIPRPASAC